MAVVVLQHVPEEGPGRVADALERAGRPVRTIPLFDNASVPVGPGGIDGLVVMGGPMSVGDVATYPHLAAERDLIADCLDAQVPILGICLGSQLLASTLGATVRPGPAPELGWLPVQLTADAAADPLMTSLPGRFEPLHWHGDIFDLPAGSVLLARSAATPVQAFRYGDTAYGLLFHLEADTDQVSAMASAFPDDLVAADVEVDALTDPLRVEAVAPLADAVFDAWTALLP